jgi:sulfite dehydrogenase (quinone) subunit SoeC
MHPAFSVIVFTTLSGAGYGLLFLVGVLSGTAILPESRWFGFFALGLSLGLASIGLVASTFHLGHPERAWRAFSQWRTSWLSREGVLSLSVFLPAGVLGIAWLFFGQVLIWAGWLSAILAALTIYCTAMIYASLKPIPRWHNGWVPLNYLLLGLMTGALLLLSLLDFFAQPDPLLAWLAILSIVLAALGKLGYWRYIDRARPVATAESATGLGGWGKVRLLEAPHSEENYLMREMGHAIARRHAGRLRRISLVVAFACPLALTLPTLWIPGPAASAASLIAAALGLLGVLIERWLFFAEAKHAVTLYYGAASV